MGLGPTRARIPRSHGERVRGWARGAVLSPELSSWLQVSPFPLLSAPPGACLQEAPQARSSRLGWKELCSLAPVQSWTFLAQPCSARGGKGDSPLSVQFNIGQRGLLPIGCSPQSSARKELGLGLSRAEKAACGGLGLCFLQTLARAAWRRQSTAQGPSSPCAQLRGPPWHPLHPGLPASGEGASLRAARRLSAALAASPSVCDVGDNGPGWSEPLVGASWVVGPGQTQIQTDC